MNAQNRSHAADLYAAAPSRLAEEHSSGIELQLPDVIVKPAQPSGAAVPRSQGPSFCTCHQV